MGGEPADEFGHALDLLPHDRRRRKAISGLGGQCSVNELHNCSRQIRAGIAVGIRGGRPLGPSYRVAGGGDGDVSPRGQ